MGQKAKNAGKKKSKVSNGKLATSYKHIRGDLKCELKEAIINVVCDKRNRFSSDTIRKTEARSMFG